MKVVSVMILFMAIKTHNSRTACDLIDTDPTLARVVTREGISVMTYAIQVGNLAVVNKLLEHHVEITDEHFNIASQNGHADILHALGEHICEYDERSSEEELRKTPALNTNLFSLFGELETTSHSSNTLRAVSAPKTLQTTDISLRSTPQAFARIVSDASSDLDSAHSLSR